jgi:hypothetical protein
VLILKYMGGRKDGQPYKMTPEVMDIIIHEIEQGVPLKYAAAAGGVTVETLWRHRKENKEFNVRADRARLTRLKLLQSCNMKAALKGDARAAEWSLTKEFPEEFGDTKKIELSGGLNLSGLVKAMHKGKGEEGDNG